MHAAMRTFAAKRHRPMRHLTILTPLAALLLISCEPSQESGGAANTAPLRRDGSAGVNLPGNSANNERIAAQDSLGKPPPPHNFVEGVEDECPVHHERMTVREIPIVFENGAPQGTDPASFSLTARFPFGAEKIVSTGNALLPSEPLTARVYQCASCIAARKAAGKKFTPASAPQ